MGLSPREAKADLSLIPHEVFKAIPTIPLDTLLRGQLPAKGFGIGGNVGSGKTMALAAIFKKHFRSIHQVIDSGGGLINHTKRLWSCWPDEVSTIRRHATEEATTERLEALQICPLLVLDDLGRERIKGSYTDDWAASQLDSIVNFRYRNELPILWTTNVRELDLLKLYGSAMYSRLTADNPLIWIDGLTDLRG